MIQKHPLEPSTLTIRTATTEDIPFLAQIIAAAFGVPPSNECVWDEVLEETGIDTLAFLEAAIATGAWLWGKVEDFRILEENGQPVAGAAASEPNLENYHSLDLGKLDAIAAKLNESEVSVKQIRDRYIQLTGDDLRPDFFKPQAPWMIEVAAVIPEARGRGFAKILLRDLIEEGRSRGHSHAGITVVNGNDRAQHVYESLGFRVYLTYGADYFEDTFPGLTQLRLALV